MSIYSRFGISLALSLTTGLIAGLSTPSIASATALPKSAIVAQAQTATFTDVPPNYWASDYIEGLARLNVISGFGDGTFKPDEIVTRAQFAAILRQAFLSSQPATAQPFADVPADYWAADAISAARSAGFLSGYPGNKFGPNDWISRVDTLVSLANGLKLPAANPEESLAEYTDASSLPDYARPAIAAAAQANIIVSYPNIDRIQGTYATATRAEVAASVYQALVKQERATLLPAKARERWQTRPFTTLPTGASKMSFSGTEQQIATLAFGNDRLQIWNVQTGALLKEITADKGNLFYAIALNRDGTKIAAVLHKKGDADGQSSLPEAVALAEWSVETGKQLWQKPLGSTSESNYIAAFIRLAYSPDDRQIAALVDLDANAEGLSSGELLTLHDAATGDFLQSLGSASGPFAFSPDGRFLAYFQPPASDSPQRTPDEKPLQVWQLEADNRFRFSRAYRSYPLDIVITRDNLLNSLTGSSFISGNGIDSYSLDTFDLKSAAPVIQTDLSSGDRTDRLALISPDGAYFLLEGDVVGSRLTNIQTRQVTGVNGDGTTFSGSGDYIAVRRISFGEEPTVGIFSKVPSAP